MVRAIRVSKHQTTFLWLTAFMVTATFFALWYVPNAAAQQLDFTVRDYGYKAAYAFKWRDFQGHIHSTNFKLETNMVRKASTEFQPFSNREANQHVFTTVKNYASQLRSRGISMTVGSASHNGKVEIKAKGSSRRNLRREMNTVDRLIEKSRKQYIHNNMFRLYDENSVVPDHARIAQMNVRRMRPVARALKKTAPRSLRGQINHTLAFLQGIPYDELLSRINSNGSGFATPVELLTRNIGDCDSKSVAMASLLKNSHPRMNMVLVLVQEHAFVGVAGIRQGPKDFALKINNQTYVLAEPTGPALLPLGQIDKRSQKLLRTGDFNHVQL